MMIPISHPNREFEHVEDEILQAIQTVLRSGSYILGEQVKAFECEVAERLGVDEVIGVGSGTDSLVLALEAFGIGEGDEVITTPFTFFATGEAIERVSATPIFVDIDEETYNLDPSKITEKITERTKAILPVHLFGQPADMEAINQIANRFNLIVIEDGCQAFGATYQGKQVGQLGDAACFSFFPTKNLSTMGDGGIVATSNEKVAKKIRKLRVHGSTKKYYHDTIGHNSRLDEIHAAILRICLNHIDEWNKKRRAIANKYNEQLEGLSFMQFPKEKFDRTHVYHLYSIMTSRRDQLMDFLQKQKIQTGVYYPCCLHLQNAFHHLGYKKGDLPVAEQAAEQLCSIPIFPYLTGEEQANVISAIKQFAVRG